MEVQFKKLLYFFLLNLRIYFLKINKNNQMHEGLQKQA
jgi:hypothetical protein